MKRWILYVLITVITAGSIPVSADGSDRGNRNKNGDSKNTATLKMSHRKLSKRTAKLRKEANKNRKKQMADIRKSNQRNRNKK